MNASCRANKAPLAIVETAHVSAYYGHGSLFVLGDVNFDDGSSIELDVAALRVEWVDGAHCDAE